VAAVAAVGTGVGFCVGGLPIFTCEFSFTIVTGTLSFGEGSNVGAGAGGSTYIGASKMIGVGAAVGGFLQKPSS